MYKVMVVDTNESSLARLAKLVGEVESCEAITFGSPVEALTWCSREEPDLIVIEYRMEQLNGLQFIAGLRAVYPRDAVPLLMVTDSEQPKVRYKALTEGANDYLLKPVDPLEFAARTRNLLAIRQNHRFLTDRAAWLNTEVKKATSEILVRERDTLVRISRAAEFRDPETGAHIQRMAHYSRLIAKSLGLSKVDQDLILDASPLHDVGKIGIPDAILLKPGRLTPEEFEIMKQHAAYGYELLSGSASQVVQTGAEIALTHHEKFDGTGYPHGLKADAIPLLGRIVAVADVFDALTSERPYKKAWELDRAVAFLREGAGQHFDPHCVAAFLEKWSDILDIRTRFRDEAAAEAALLRADAGVPVT